MELLVTVVREPGADWYEMQFPDGSSEDVDPTEAVEWFRLRHAGPMNVAHIERAIDDAWNFGSVEVLIKNARVPTVVRTRVSPQLKVQ